jgi:hypothetical protein
MSLAGLLLVQLASTSCSRGSGCSDPAYIEGEWVFFATVTELSGNHCAADVGDSTSWFMTLIQDGTSLYVYDEHADHDPREGTVCGQYANFSWEGYEGDVYGEEHWVMTVSEDSLTMNGTADASYSEGSDYCNGSLDVEASRISPAVVDDETNTVIVINQRSDSGVLVVMRPANRASKRLMPIGFVEPGDTVVFPLPQGSWEVFEACADEGANQLESCGVVTNSVASGPMSDSGLPIGGFLLGL